MGCVSSLINYLDIADMHFYLSRCGQLQLYCFLCENNISDELL